MEDADLKTLISNTRLPLESQFGRLIFLLLNDAGDILRMWNDSSYCFPEIVRHIRDSGNIFRDFGADRPGDPGDRCIFSRYSPEPP